MKINKTKLDKIIETLEEYTEYDVEGNSQVGYDVTPFIRNKYTNKVIEEINNILEE